MPDPKKEESKEEFIAKFMGSEEAKKSFPDEKQRLAVANSKWEKKSKSKETTPFLPSVKIKEELEENIHTFIAASTIPDRTAEDIPDGMRIEGEILSKNVLDRIADMINNEGVVGGKYGSYRTVSLFHNRVQERNPALEEAGYIKPNARVVPMEAYPGNFALLVDAEVNEMYVPPDNYPDYTPDKIKYKIGKDALGLSIEYSNRPDQERIVSVKGENYRYVMDTDDFRGFGFARVNLIGNPTAVRVKEIYPSIESQGDQTKKREGGIKMSEDKTKEMEEQLAKHQAKIKELEEKAEAAKKEGEEDKVEEVKEEIEKVDAKVKEIKLAQDEMAGKIKESLELAFSGINFIKPQTTQPDDTKIKVKEVYSCIEGKEKDFVKFKEMMDQRFEENEAKIKERILGDMQIDGPGFNFERHQTLKVKCMGDIGKADGRMVVIPTAKTKDVIDASDMAEGTYTQTNAMFADRYVPGITETFLKEASYLTAMTKINHIGGNDKYQWRNWISYTTVTGDSTLSVDPNVTSVTRTERDFEKFESRICEYRDGVEVTDFTQHHSMAAVGDLMNLEIMRAAEAVTESMNSDLFKPKTEATTGWNGFVGLLGVADSSTYGTMYGKTRSATNRLLDSTTANTYLATAEAISVEVLRDGYEKVLAHGADLGSIAIIIHPTQMRKLWNSEDAAIRNNILTMSGAPPTFGFNRAVIPHLDGIPMIRDYRCELSAASADMFCVVDMSPNKGHVLVISKPLNVRGLAKLGTSESAYVSFWGAAVYKNPLNIFVHTGLTT